MSSFSPDRVTAGTSRPAARPLSPEAAVLAQPLAGVELQAPASPAAFYVAALRKVGQGPVSQEQTDEALAHDLPVAEAAEEAAEALSITPTDAEPVLLAQAPANAGQGAANANRQPSQKPAEDDEDGWSRYLPLGLVGVGVLAVAGASSSSSPVEVRSTVVDSDHDCDLQVNEPNAPLTSTALWLSAGTGDLVSEDAVYSAGEHASIILTADDFGNVLSSEITADGDVGDIYASAGMSGTIRVSVDVSGGAGDITLITAEDTANEVHLEVSAGADVGDFTFISRGIDAGGRADLDISGGDIGDVGVLVNGQSGSSNIYLSAYAQASGSALVGGLIGDVTIKSDVYLGQVYGYIQASGGDIGSLSMCLDGTSGSASVSASALAQVDGSGNVVGGNVGDIVVSVYGQSADGNWYVDARGASDGDGDYLGGGSIGDITILTVNAGEYDGAEVNASAYGGGSIGNVTLTTIGGSQAESEARLYTESGGDVGNLTLKVSGANMGSGSASVELDAYGSAGNASEIGTITMDIYEGQNSSAGVFLSGYVNANFGNTVATVHGGGSGEIDIVLIAEGSAGVGGTIGDVTVVDHGRFSDIRVSLDADQSIGSVDVTIGGGDGDLYLELLSDTGTGTIGETTITLSDDFYGGFDDDSHVWIVAASGTTVGDLTVSGGSEFSQMSVWSMSSGAYVLGEVVGNIDMSGFNGSSDIFVHTALDGVRIDVGQGGSMVTGTAGSDDIYLGDGSDTVDFDYFESGEGVDDIFNFEAGSDDFFVLTNGLGTFQDLTSNTATALSDADVVSLVDLAGGDDIMSSDGLLDALNGGEYDNVDGLGGSYTFVTASSNTDDEFNVYHVLHDGTNFTEAYLMAVVDMAAGQDFNDLSGSDFVEYIR